MHATSQLLARHDCEGFGHASVPLIGGGARVPCRRMSSARNDPDTAGGRRGDELAPQSCQVGQQAGQVGRGSGPDLCLRAFQFVLELSFLVRGGSLIDDLVAVLGQRAFGVGEKEFLFHPDGAGAG